MSSLVVFNHFMAGGYDDVAEGIGYLDIDLRGDCGGVLEWEPFALTQEEYNALLEHIRSLGGEFEVVDWDCYTYRNSFEMLCRLTEKKRR